MSKNYTVSKDVSEIAPVYAIPSPSKKPARSIVVYPLAKSSRLFPGWSPVTGIFSRAQAHNHIRAFAKAVERRFPAAHQVTIVYEPSGAVYGTVTLNRILVGFYLPFLSKSSPLDSEKEIIALAGVLANVQDLEGLKRELGQHSPEIHTSDVIEISSAEQEVVPNRVDEPQSTIGRLMATYYDDRYQHVQVRGRVKPPQPSEVDRFLTLLFPLLIPGYSGPLPDDVEFESFVCRRVSAIQKHLGSLIRRSMAFYDTVRGKLASLEDYREAANRMVVAFFDSLPQIRITLDRDIRAAYRDDPALPEGDSHVVPLAYPGFIAIAIQRIAHLLHNLEVPYLPRMMTENGHSRTGIDIHPGAQIGHGFFVDHGTGVVIGETSIIEDNVTLYQGVTLGALNFPKDDNGNLLNRGGVVKRHPTVRSDTKVYANAAILGDITVGLCSRIGSNVSLRDSVENEATVRIDPAIRDLLSRVAYPTKKMPPPLTEETGESQTTNEAPGVDHKK